MIQNTKPERDSSSLLPISEPLTPSEIAHNAQRAGKHKTYGWLDIMAWIFFSGLLLITIWQVILTLDSKQIKHPYPSATRRP